MSQLTMPEPAMSELTKSEPAMPQPAMSQLTMDGLAR